MSDADILQPFPRQNNLSLEAVNVFTVLIQKHLGEAYPIAWSTAHAFIQA